MNTQPAIQVEDPREAVFQVLWAWFQELAEDEVLMEKLTN